MEEFQLYRVGNCLISPELNMIIRFREGTVVVEMQNLPPINLNKQYYPEEYERYKTLQESSPEFVVKCKHLR